MSRWREAKEFAKLPEMADLVDTQTAAENYTGKWEQDAVTGEYLDKNTHELAQALLNRQVPSSCLTILLHFALNIIFLESFCSTINWVG